MFCGTLGFHGTPVEVYWARWCLSTHTEIYFDEHKSNYTFIRITRNVFWTQQCAFTRKYKT